MQKFYRIAGLVVKMDTFGRTEVQAEPYRIPDQTGFDIEIIPDWSIFRKRYPDASDDMCEYMTTGYAFYRELLRFGGLQLHSSCVVLDGRAYLFSAHPGTGKSTHTQQWLERFGKRAYILNDDKPALCLENGEWFAYGTPWSGKNDISVNARVPVAGIAMLERSECNSIEQFFGAEALAKILPQVVRPRGQEYRVLLLEMMDKLLSMVPVWKFECNNFAPDAVDVSYSAMARERKV